jgi:hypothetical protein
MSKNVGQQKPTKETKPDQMRPNFRRAPPNQPQDFYQNRVAAAPVRGVLCLVIRTRKRFFQLF